MRRQYGICIVAAAGFAALSGPAEVVKAAGAEPDAAGAQAARPNVLLIIADDLRPELACFGADYIHSPNIDRFAATAVSFDRHYVNAPSCGPSRYTLLTGRFGPAGNQALFKRAALIRRQSASVPPSMPAWFRQHGYTTVAVGKVSHHPGGMGGKQWDDPSDLEMPAAWDRQPLPVGAWKSPSGIMHGLAHGEIRGQSGDMDVFQSVDGPDDIYPDGLIVREGLKQLEELASSKDKPFFLAIGVIKPHLPFGAPKAYFDLYDGAKLPPVPHPEKPGFKTTWHKSGEFMKYRRWGRDPCTDPEFADDVRRHYAACVSYTDKHVGDILNRLKETGAEENTVVLIWGDHGWHLGEHGVWGKHTLFEEALRAPLIIRYPGMKERGKTCHAVVDTVNIFPTLCEITGVPEPDFADGKSLLPMLEDTSHAGHPAVAYWGGKQSLRNDRYRLVVHEDGYVELYDHAGDAGETENIAGEHPDVVRELSAMLSERLKSAELDG